jgi:hypothetical protein
MRIDHNLGVFDSFGAVRYSGISRLVFSEAPPSHIERRGLLV